MSGTGAAWAGDLRSHAESEAGGAQWMAWHQGRGGLPTPSLFSMATVLGCRLWKAFQPQGLVLTIWWLMAKGSHASWLMGIAGGASAVLWMLRSMTPLGWDPSLSDATVAVAVRWLAFPSPGSPHPSCWECITYTLLSGLQSWTFDNSCNQEVTQENLEADFQARLS